MIDLIGDIHGYADKLEELLENLGYVKNDGVYSHPERKVLFIGDYIDRGPQIRETLGIVKSMVDSGNAIALMGNHEYNALCFHFQETQGGHLRGQSIPVGVNFERRVLVVIQPGAAHLFVAQIKTQRLYQVQLAAGVGGQANHVARVGWNFRVNQDDVKHGPHFHPWPMARQIRPRGAHRCARTPWL